MQLPIRTISANHPITVTRLLPIDGEILVQRQQKVQALEIVGRTTLPSRFRVIEVARQLGQAAVDMDEVMVKAEGGTVEMNEAIAVQSGRLPLLRRTVRAPVEGRIASIGPGWVLLETDRSEVELPAFINGIVTRVIPNRGVVIASSGAMIAAACGFGGEAYGSLKRPVNANFETLQPEAIDERYKDSILLGGVTVDETILRAAEEAQVRGIIVGSIEAGLLELDPPVRVRVVATEGFGQMPMSPYTFGVLATLTERDISIRGSTPVLSPNGSYRHPVEPPLILASSTRGLTESDGDSARKASDIKVGTRVRVTYGPLLGANGTVDAIPAEPQKTEAGLIVPGAYVTLENARYFIPWANLEQVN